MTTNLRRLYIFTGKGGVGKTTLAKAFARNLANQGEEVAYLTFKNSALSESHSDQNTDERIDGLREISLDLEDCARSYIERKLNSKMVGGWIVKTPFFRALINMIPGFNYLIYLGKVLELGHENKKLIIVLDAPASGHALTMVESTTNFQQIFESGAVFDDTKKMLSRLNDPNYTKVFVLSLPSQMSWQEAQELKTGLNERTPVEVDIIINNALYPLVENQLDDLPTQLRQKALNEKKLIEENISNTHCILNHSLKTNSLEIERELVGSLSKLI